MQPFEWALILGFFGTIIALMMVANVMLLMACMKLYTEFFKQVVMMTRGDKP